MPRAGRKCCWSRPATKRWNWRWPRRGARKWRKFPKPVPTLLENERAPTGRGRRRFRSDHLRSLQAGAIPARNTLFIGETPPPLEAQSIAAKAARRKRRNQLTARRQQIRRREGLVAGGIGDLSANYRCRSQHPLTQWLLDLGDVDIIVEARPVTAPPGGTRIDRFQQGHAFGDCLARRF